MFTYKSSPFFRSAEETGSRYASRNTLRNPPGDSWRKFPPRRDQTPRPFSRVGVNPSASKRMSGPPLGG